MASLGLFYQFEWLHSSHCSGPPSTITAYSASNLYLAHVNHVIQNSSYPKCGISSAASQPDLDQCCFSSLDDGGQGISPFQSYGAIFSQLIPNTSLPLLPSSASGSTYCRLHQDAPGINKTRKLFESMWILGSNTEDCYEGSFKCSSNGSLHTFASDNCTGTVVQFSLDPLIPQNFTWIYTESKNISIVTSENISIETSENISTVMGYFSLDMITVGPANADLSASYSWVTSFPPWKMKSINEESLEIFGTVCQFLLIVMAFGTSAFYLGRTLTIARITYKLLFIIHLIWAVFGALDVYLSFWSPSSSSYAFDHPGEYCSITTLGNYFLAFATLGTYLVNADLVIRIIWGSLRGSMDNSLSSAVNGGLVAVHLGLFGYMYLTFPACLDHVANPSSPFYETVYSWNRALGGIWYIYFILFDAISSFAITYYIVQQGLKNKRSSIIHILKWTLQDLPVTLTIISQIILVVLFAITYYIPRYTLLPASDRNLLAYQNIRSFVLYLHAVMSCFSFDYLAVTLLKVTAVKKKIKARISAAGKRGNNGTSPVGLSDGPVFSPSPLSPTQEGSEKYTRLKKAETSTNNSRPNANPVVTGDVHSEAYASSRRPQQPTSEVEEPEVLQVDNTVRLDECDTRKV